MESIRDSVESLGFKMRERFYAGQEAGWGAVVKALARRLGKRVMLRQPVRRIAQTRTGVRVHTDKLVVNAKQVIVAVPPALAGRIEYSPILPFVTSSFSLPWTTSTSSRMSSFSPGAPSSATPSTVIVSGSVRAS